MSDEHEVTFHANHIGFVARCSCGWSHTWTPWSDIPERDYTLLLGYGLRHARQKAALPERVKISAA